MGNVEKWVVLGVLGLIVGILVISLNLDDPLKKDKVVLAGAPEKTETPKVDPGVPPAAKDPAPAASAPLLSTAVETPAPAAAIPSGSILKTMDGLQESYMTDAMFYTWKAGDTFPGLAQRFYGDPSRLAILKRMNEGRTDVQPGERVLVPVYDLDAVPAAAPAPAPAPAVASPKAKADAPKSAETSAPAASSSTSGPRYHVVKDGESLWKIAKQELGSGSRWNDIYNANRDVLSSPEALHTGQKLRVP
jgi:nucleoid-associated protein YgaU